MALKGGVVDDDCLHFAVVTFLIFRCLLFLMLFLCSAMFSVAFVLCFLDEMLWMCLVSVLLLELLD